MRQIIKKVTAITIMLSICICSIILPVSAAVQSSYYLNAYRAWISNNTAGRININVDVRANDYMDEVGASRIQIYESADGGETWKSVRIYLKSLYPELVVNNNWFYNDTAVTYKGTIGYQYFAVVTVYAGDSTGSDTRDYTTNVVTAIKK